MSIAEVKLWGRSIGAVSWDERRNLASFEYDSGFRDSGIQVAPLQMSLSPQIFSFPSLSKETFKGLPGLLVDSLPDDFGNALIDVWLAKQGRSADAFNAVERLCYIGTRGMGALEYIPSNGPQIDTSDDVNIDELVVLASKILKQRDGIKGSFNTEYKESTLNDILSVGTSAGGARAKAVIAWNQETNEVRSGQLKAIDGFSHWLLKFDGVSGNKDKELDDPTGYGLIEYAYYLMAKDAGININESRLLKEKGRQHFMTKRFDRTDAGKKIHMQSLAALQHFDFKLAGAYSYEQALQTIRRLDMPMEAIEEQFRRMVFNIVARNQDDHVKNISFLMSKSGQWSLSPAYDVTYAYNPLGDWTSQHQMSLNGKRDNFNLDDFKLCAKNISMKRGKAEEIIKQVQDAVMKWGDIAAGSGVDSHVANSIKDLFRFFI